MAAKKMTKKANKKASPKNTAKKAAKKAVKKVKSTKSTKKSTKKSDKKAETPVFDTQEHFLVPKHEILGEKEIQDFFEQYDVQPTNLPTIFINDAALKGMDVKIGDIIKITRKSYTAGESVFYRRVAYE